MRKVLFFLALILSGVLAFAMIKWNGYGKMDLEEYLGETVQNTQIKQATIEGKIVDRIYGVPLYNANISLYKRVWDVMQDGLPSLHPMEESVYTGITLHTDSLGYYKTQVKLTSNKEYYMLRVTANGFEPINYTLIVLENGKVANLYTIEMIKSNPTNAEQKILHDKDESDWKKVQSDKMLHRDK